MLNYYYIMNFKKIIMGSILYNTIMIMLRGPEFSSVTHKNSYYLYSIKFMYLHYIDYDYYAPFKLYTIIIHDVLIEIL